MIHGHVNFRAVCISGWADFTMTADAYDVGGLIAPGIAEGTITIQLQSVTSGFRGFNLDVNGLPGFIEDLFEDDVRDKVASVSCATRSSRWCRRWPTSSWPSSWPTPTRSILFGQTIELAFWPSAMSWTEAGGTIVLDTCSAVSGVEGVYLSTPQPRPSDADMASNGLRIALADDVLNQLLASVWASGALEDTMLPGEHEALGGAFGADVDSATITLLLPPVANFDTTTGTARLTIGDLVVDAYAADGSTLAVVRGVGPDRSGGDHGASGRSGWSPAPRASLPRCSSSRARS